MPFDISNIGYFRHLLILHSINVTSRYRFILMRVDYNFDILAIIWHEIVFLFPLLFCDINMKLFCLTSEVKQQFYTIF